MDKIKEEMVGQGTENANSLPVDEYAYYLISIGWISMNIVKINTCLTFA